MHQSCATLEPSGITLFVPIADATVDTGVSVADLGTALQLWIDTDDDATIMVLVALEVLATQLDCRLACLGTNHGRILSGHEHIIIINQQLDGNTERYPVS